jgi:tetratricopeptide (TPR) repeat protein
LGEHKEAVEDFSKAIDYASEKLKHKLITYVLIFKLRGKEYLELKEYGKAIDDFSESLRLNSDDMLLLRTKSFYPDAEDELLPYLANFFIPEDDSNTLLLIAKAYLSGEKDKIKTVFEEYLNRKRKDADTKGREEIYKLTGLKPEDIL